MDAAMSPHLTDQALGSYALGKLDVTSAEEVDRHLGACPDCRKRAAEMSADSFLGRVRDARKGTGRSTLGQSQADGTLSGVGPKVSAPPPADTLPPGLADHPDYEIKKELGRGGMGVVYLAHNTLLGRDEVLKVMGRQIMDRPGVLDRFLREMRAVARLRHPNIVTAYSATRLGESIVFGMEHVEGLDLSKLVKAKGPLPVGHACNFVYQAALGLQHAHEEGLVHRDIKPANLMLSRKGDKATVKVLDFGLAKVAREEKIDGGLTSVGQALGTPDYIAPEQILDAPSADIRADIYSLGGTLYYLLTGRPPFKASSLYDMYQAHISRDADPLNLVRPEVPSELAALVAKMMAKDPARRFQTPGEVAQALTPFFKKANAAIKSPRTDVSQNGPTVVGVVSTTTQRGSDSAIPAPRAKDAAAPTASESQWKNPIKFRDEKSLMDAAPAAEPTRRPPGTTRPKLIAASLFGLILLGVIVITIKNKNGETTKITLADGKAAKIEQNGVTIEIDPAKAASPIRATDAESGDEHSGDVRGVESSGRPGRKKAAGGTGDSPSPTSNTDRNDEGNPWPESLSPSGLKFPLDGDVFAMSRDGRVMAQKASPTSVRIVRPPDASKAVLVELGYTDRRTTNVTVLSPDGKLLARCGEDDKEKSLRVWDTTDGRMLHKLPKGRLVGDPFSLDDLLVASVGHSGRGVKFWDVASGKELGLLSPNVQFPFALAFSPDRQRLAIGFGDWQDGSPTPGELKIWDLKTQTSRRLEDHGRRVTSVAFSPDGKSLASGGYDKVVKTWAIPELRNVATFDGHKGRVVGVRFSPNGRLVASIAENDPVRVWEAATGGEVATFSGLSGTPAFVEFSPSGRWVFAGEGQIVKSWEVPTDSRLRADAAGGLPTAEDSDTQVGKALGPPAPYTLKAVPFEGTNAGQERNDNSLKMKFCWCPGGIFTAGSPLSEPKRFRDEGPVEVRLSRGFWIGKYEVTQTQWKQVMGTTIQQRGYQNDWPFFFGIGADFPMYLVSHTEAEEFARKLTTRERTTGQLPPNFEYRLPTEAQWEYACRAGTTTATAFGDSLGGADANCDGNNPYNGAAKSRSLNKTCPVGRYRANDWGLHDMHGNVSEWCRDGYAEKLAGGIDPQGPLTASARVYRGGAWDSLPSDCRSAYRESATPESRRSTGFRLVSVLSVRLVGTESTPGIGGTRSRTPQISDQADRLQFGTVWRGPFKYSQPLDLYPQFDAELTITRRVGNTFEGTYSVVKKIDQCLVRGTIANGSITWEKTKGVKGGLASDDAVSWSGKIEGDRIDVRAEHLTSKGEPAVAVGSFLLSP